MYSHNQWIRNDGVTLADMVKLWGQLDHFHRPYKGHFTFFNRLQNLGYTREDMNNNTITVSGIQHRENLLFEKYKQRLASL